MNEKILSDERRAILDHFLEVAMNQHKLDETQRAMLKGMQKVIATQYVLIAALMLFFFLSIGNQLIEGFTSKILAFALGAGITCGVIYLVSKSTWGRAKLLQLEIWWALRQTEYRVRKMK